MQANIFVLDHDAPGLQRITDVEVLFTIERWSHQAVTQLRFAAIFGEGDTIHRADIDAGVAFDTQLPREHRLDIAIEATLGLEIGLLFVEAKFDFDLDVLQRHRCIAPGHFVAEIVRDVVVVAPLVNAHLLADERHAGWRPLVHILAVAQFVDRDCRVMAVGDRPDDVLRSKSGIAAEKYVRQRGLHRLRVDLGHVPAVELDADVTLDPREGVLLTDCDQTIVTRNVSIGLTGWDQVAAPASIVFRLDLLEEHPGQTPAFVSELLRHQPVEDRDVFVHRVLFLPGRGFHLVKTAAHDDRDLFAAEPARGTAAIHRGIAAPEHDDAAADFVDMTKRDAGQPVDADMDVIRRLRAAGDVEIAPARRAATDEDCIPVVAQQRLEAADEFPEMGLHSHVEDQIDLLVSYRFRQAKARDLRPHHAAALCVAVEQHAVIAEGQQIARDGKGCGAGADEGDALAVLLTRDRR